MFSDLMHGIWIFLHNKKLTAAAALFVILIEIKRGYFSGFLTYLRSLRPKPYVILFLLLPVVFIPLVFMDQKILAAVQSVQSPLVLGLFRFGGQWGEDLWIYLLGIYLIVLPFRKLEWRRILFGALLGGALNGLFATLIKISFTRARPMVGLGPHSFFHLEGLLKDDGRFQSFPSGDVAIVAGAAMYLCFCLRNPFLRFLILIIPVLTAFSRMSLDRHWPSDTAASFVLCLIAAKFLSEFSGGKRSFVWEAREDEKLNEN